MEVVSMAVSQWGHQTSWRQMFWAVGNMAVAARRTSVKMVTKVHGFDQRGSTTAVYQDGDRGDEH
ncbi:hypothetical protein SAMD00019534_038350 [Acytostelium subglobosum LB1]|uniref:hypothetical protein n=1 Tax=Acytostelium subglobosum LB1 TaxID=1410327 RepID=UPI000644EAA5|nr:hypothetical protein SAMD00019534_038350 [Acytostelium subglobosum LB1]GAM20660.1 hypothetical protein SAMD00019534_038350 [Acytostelium subglobosum LB1]|eukprot:XP_012760181.1 hypothetical protein SAMD00019534_038350 [Acytostelium subglobosum LB1]